MRPDHLPTSLCAGHPHCALFTTSPLHPVHNVPIAPCSQHPHCTLFTTSPLHPVHNVPTEPCSRHPHCTIYKTPFSSLFGSSCLNSFISISIHYNFRPFPFSLWSLTSSPLAICGTGAGFFRVLRFAPLSSIPPTFNI